jgi:CheY-like chemotaxis protein
MPRIPSVAQTEPSFRPLATAARKLAVTGRSCANCGSHEIRPSNRRNALDVLLACVFLAPFRCRVCRGRFYRMWRPSLQRATHPPIAPLLLVPARRTDFAMDGVELRRSEPESVPAFVASPAAEPQPVRPIASTTPGPILILESDLSIRKLLRRLLERRGYNTVEVAEADDLAGELLDHNVDLLIVDVSTVEAGVEAVVAFARALPSLKILALSAEPLLTNEIPERLLVLPKPFALDSFVDCVDRLLGRPSSPDISM